VSRAISAQVSGGQPAMFAAAPGRRMVKSPGDVPAQVLKKAL
jgi:hypothetical protein